MENSTESTLKLTSDPLLKHTLYLLYFILFFSEGNYANFESNFWQNIKSSGIFSYNGINDVFNAKTFHIVFIFLQFIILDIEEVKIGSENA